jgi:hypothetical protein
VVVALELDDRLAAGRRARQPQGSLDHFGSCGPEAHAFRTRDELAHEPCGLELRLSLSGKQDASIELRLGGLDHAPGVMTQDHRPHSQVVIDQPIAIDIGDVGAAATFNDKRGWRDA